MTEISGFWTTSGTPSGHQVSGYTQAVLSTAFEIMAACARKEGVAANILNELVGSVPGANTARIGTGGAMADGKWYENDAAVDVTIPSAVGAGNTRIDRVVLRVSWASYQATITRIAGTDAASPVAPAITQTSGTTYDIQLYQALVDTSGVVTLTDERVFATSPVLARQGGDATNWAAPGTTDYDRPTAIMQAGAASLPFGSGSTVVVTFPEPFADVPLVVTGIFGAAFSTMPYISAITATTVTFYNTSVYPLYVYWIAIGPN